MAIGKNQIEIKGQDFIQGISTAPDTTDGGFSPEGYNVSLTNVPGCIAPTYASSASTLLGNVICSCDAGANATIGKFLLTLSVSTAGYIYYQDASTGTYSEYGSYTGNCGNLYSDMVSYRGDVFFSTDIDVGHIPNSNTTSGTVDSTWFSVTKSGGNLIQGKKHHLFVFGDKLYIADGQYLHVWDGTTLTPKILSISTSTSSDREIITIGADVTNNHLLLSFISNAESASQGSGTGTGFIQTKTYQYFVGVWDVFTATKLLLEIPVEDVIWAFIYFGGYQYVIYGTNFGYFTGTGIQFLRKLNFDQTQAVQVINKHKIVTTPSFIFIADQNQILGYGNITKLQNIFWYLFSENILNANILSLMKSSPILLGIGFGDAGFSYKTFNLTSNNASILDAVFYSLQYYFPRPVYIREVDIEFKSAVATGEVGFIYLIGDDNFQAEMEVINKNDSATVYSLRQLKPTVSDLMRKCNRLQVKYAFAVTIPVRRIIIRYDVAE